MTMIENKRIHKRIPIAGLVNLTIHYIEDDVTIEAMISYVSLTGIGIYADRQIEDGTEVSLEINFISSDGLMKNTLMQGHIIYYREMGHLFLTGIEFTEEINSEEHKEFYDHIQHTLKLY
jgi:hypothetical protein